MPKWNQIVDVIWSTPEDQRDNPAVGFDWDNIDPDTSQQGYLRSGLNELKPGQKLYVVFRVAYLYNIPGGNVETKWDPILKKSYQQTSAGMIGYEYSAPIGACTIELK